MPEYYSTTVPAFASIPTLIYGFFEYPDGPCRYVGKTTTTLGRRKINHISTAVRGIQSHLPICRWILRKREQNEPLHMVLLETVPSGEDWIARERFWITHFRSLGASLLNITTGGEGLSGYVHTPEHAEKIRQKLRSGATLSCPSCGKSFYRKRKEMKKSRNKQWFCSRACYAVSLTGKTKPMPIGCAEAGIHAAAEKRRQQTHCKYGHHYTLDNIFILPEGGRGCKKCRKIHQHRSRMKAEERRRIEAAYRQPDLFLPRASAPVPTQLKLFASGAPR